MFLFALNPNLRLQKKGLVPTQPSPIFSKSGLMGVSGEKTDTYFYFDQNDTQFIIFFI
jgi:hypothetical protein